MTASDAVRYQNPDHTGAAEIVQPTCAPAAVFTCEMAERTYLAGYGVLVSGILKAPAPGAPIMRTMMLL
ncbi:hypothetical protein D6T65_19325, partial [Arthrobacter frigidicola]